jgi:hypothetical protein
MEPPDPAGAAPFLPSTGPRQPSRIGQWLEDSEPGQGTPAPLPATAEEAPIHYAASVASTAGSRHSISNNFRKLKKSIEALQNIEAMGEKTIAYKLKDMSTSTDKLREKVNSEEDLEAGLIAEIEEALDTADLLAENAVIQLDKLTAEKE